IELLVVGLISGRGRDADPGGALMALRIGSTVGSMAAGAAVLAMATGAGAAGPISFAPAVNSPTGESYGPGPGAETTVVTDLDGDGRRDVVITDFATTTPRAMRNIGGGRFAAAVPLP